MYVCSPFQVVVQLENKESLSHFYVSYPVLSATRRFTWALLYFWPSLETQKLSTFLTLLEHWCLDVHTSLYCPFPQFPSSRGLCVGNGLYWKVGENTLQEEKHLNLHSKRDCSLSPKKMGENKKTSFIGVPLLTALTPKLYFSILMSELLPHRQLEIRSTLTHKINAMTFSSALLKS